MSLTVTQRQQMAQCVKEDFNVIKQTVFIHVEFWVMTAVDKALFVVPDTEHELRGGDLLGVLCEIL